MTKLSFPGVLFHHQTPNKDWFYDEMQPWVHYIPVAWHLGDLKEKFIGQWLTRKLQKKSPKEISKRASELFEEFMSEAYMQKVYDILFDAYLGGVLAAHLDPYIPWSDIKKTYEEAGFTLDRVSVCDDRSCSTVGGDGGEVKMEASFVPENTTVVG